MHFGAIANSARGGPPRPPPVRDRVKMATSKVEKITVTLIKRTAN